MFVLFKSTLSSQPLKTLFKTEIKGKIKSSKLEQKDNHTQIVTEFESPKFSIACNPAAKKGDRRRALQIMFLV